jgi:hypothetical protein
LCDESITTIKKREKQLIDGIIKHSLKLQNEIELERKTVKKTFCDLKRQADQAEKTIILHQDEQPLNQCLIELVVFSFSEVIQISLIYH